VIIAPPDNIEVLIPPVVEPVSLADAKAQIGLLPEQDDHNFFIAQKISAARRLIEQRLGITMVATKLRGVWREAPRVVVLPAPPLLVDADHPVVVKLDGETVPSGDYEVDADLRPGEITLGQAASGKLVVEWWAGREPGYILCPLLHSAILMYTDHSFANRGVVVTDGSQPAVVPLGFDDLLAASSWSGRY
jgi:uncharacterized phiE125 gp8 family phage protein